MSVFKYSNSLPSCKNLKKKLISHFWENAVLADGETTDGDRQADGQTKQQWLYRTLCRIGVVQKLWHILRYHKIRSTFCTENTLHKLLCNQVGTEDKEYIIFEIDCNNYQAVYFNKSKWSVKLGSDEHKRSVKNCNYENNEIIKHCWKADHNFSWDQKV